MSSFANGDKENESKATMKLLLLSKYNFSSTSVEETISTTSSVMFFSHVVDDSSSIVKE